MAKHTISEASRITNVARSTLHRAIRKGRLSLDPDGRIDTAELLRAGYMLQQHAPVERAPSLHDGAPHPDAPATRLLQQEMELLQRERDLLQRELDATRTLLHQTQQAAQERDTAAQEREAWLRRLVEQVQQQATRLLEAHTPAAVPLERPQARQEVILAYFQAHPGRYRAATLQQAMGLPSSPERTLQRMVKAGLLRSNHGVFELPE